MKIVTIIIIAALLAWLIADNDEVRQLQMDMEQGL
jgi:hypothetical protein